MRTKERYEGIIGWFSEHMPVAESELHYENPFQLLVAVALSAQCTDKRVNMTTPALFATFPTPQAMAAATAEEIFPYIRSISYPNNKARNLAAMARKLCADFGGEVPSDLKALQTLPGVGRKTANVLGAVLWQKEVMPVDTHVALRRGQAHRRVAARQPDNGGENRCRHAVFHRVHAHFFCSGVKDTSLFRIVARVRAFQPLPHPGSRYRQAVVGRDGCLSM